MLSIINIMLNGESNHNGIIPSEVEMGRTRGRARNNSNSTVDYLRERKFKQKFCCRCLAGSGIEHF